MSERKIKGGRERFAHYRIGEVLGEGGFGRVYMAWDERLAREVAIKFSSPDRRRQEGLRFEAQRLASQRHRAFVNVFALEECTDEIAMVMELVRGRTLAKVLDDGPLLQDEVVRLGIEATAALAEAHHSGWAHGDLKPSNLMVSDNGWLRILDFGAASAIDPLDTSSTVSGDTQAGTLAYMAPERMLGGRASVAGDVYSLGLVLFEALTRRVGADDEGSPYALHERLYGPEEGRKLPVRFDAALRSLIECMTRRRPQKRPASMEQVHSALIQWQVKHASDPTARKPRRTGSVTVGPGTLLPSRFHGKEAVNSPFEATGAAIIRVSFDVEQSGTGLWFDRGLNASIGRYAGAVHLREGEAVTVEVTGYGAAGKLVSTNLLDAVLCAVPIQGSSDRNPPPSPFSHARATMSIEQWSPAEIRRDGDGVVLASVQRSLTPVQVVQRSGRWNVSLILTVMIERHIAGGRSNEVRVFSFSPETAVGPAVEHALTYSG